jgi:hypothetical protein
LLPLFHSSVQLFQAPESLNLGELKSRISIAIAREKELVIDPALFLALQNDVPRIGSVEVLLKRGSSDNELTRYRYDVVLHIGDTAISAAQQTVNWEISESSISDLARYLRDSRPAAVRITNIPNKRLARDVAIMRLLETMDEHCEVEELRRALLETRVVGEDPEAFWALAEATGYAAQISWKMGSGEGCFDVWLKHGAQVAAAFESSQGRLPTILQRTWDAYTSHPSNAPRRDLAPALRKMLQISLPEYMVPSAFVVLEALPLTPNGKIDRRALPAPEGAAVMPGEYVAPRTPTEKVLAGIWCEVLKLERIGVHDNFFELGGHSLLAMRVMAGIYQTVAAEVPLTTIFRNPKLNQLAEVLDQILMQKDLMTFSALDEQSSDDFEEGEILLIE